MVVLSGDLEVASSAATQAPSESVPPIGAMLTGTDRVEACRNNAVWTSENDGHLQLLLSLWCLPAWAKDWLAKLELETDTVNAVSRSWIRIYFCNLLPLIQMGCAFQSY